MRGRIGRRGVGGAVAALTLACLSGAWAEEGGCPPLGPFPGHRAAPPRLRVFDETTFRRADAGPARDERVAGPACSVIYTLTDEGGSADDAEVRAALKDQLAHLGAEILFADPRGIVARQFKGRKETWMSVDDQGSEIAVTVATRQSAKPRLAAPGPGDDKRLGPMPGYLVRARSDKASGAAEFDVQAGAEVQTLSVQGHTVELTYRPRPGAPLASDAEIQFNYRDALKALKTDILYTDDHTTVGRLVDAGQAVWVRVYSREDGIDLATVEERGPPPAAPVSAAGLAAALDRQGRATLPVGFDFGRAVLRPEARPVLAEVAALLRGAPTLRVAVEDHTDDIGTAAAAETLSGQRAEAIVQALVGRGIAPDRLSARGFGATRPIASNLTSLGRARNARVELVKQ